MEQNRFLFNFFCVVFFSLYILSPVTQPHNPRLIPRTSGSTCQTSYPTWRRWQNKNPRRRTTTWTCWSIRSQAALTLSTADIRDVTPAKGYDPSVLCAQVSTQGHQSTPLNLVVGWKCEPTTTDLRIDYKYYGDAMSTPMALNNVQFLVPVDGGVSKLQVVLPPAAWYATDIWK